MVLVRRMVVGLEWTRDKCGLDITTNGGNIYINTSISYGTMAYGL